MADKRVLALDVTTEAVAGVALQESKQGVEILSAHFCRLGDSLSFSEALAEILDHCKISPDRCLVSVGPEQLQYRLLNIPFADLKKVRSVVPFEIEDSVAFQDEPFLFDYLLQPAAEEGTDVFAAIAKKQLIQQLLDEMSEHGLDPEVVTVSALPSVWNAINQQDGSRASFVLLHIDWTKTSVFIVIDNEIKAIRSIPSHLKDNETTDEREQEEITRGEIKGLTEQALRRLAGDIRYSLVALESMLPEGADLPMVFEGAAGRITQVRDFLLTDLNSSLWQGYSHEYGEIKNYETLAEHPQRGCFDAVLALACCRPKERERVNFRKDDYAFAGQNGNYSKVAKYAAAALVLVVMAVVIYQAVNYRSMKLQRAELSEEIESLYVQTVPDSIAGPDPVKQLQVKVRDLNDASASGTVHNPSINVVKVMADISARVPASMQVSFERFIYDRKSVRVRGLTDNFNTVDQMKNRLAQSPLFSEVAIGSANVDQKAKGVRFELKMQL